MASAQKKIFLDEQDGIRDVKRRLSRIQTGTLTLVIPRGSILGGSVDRFHELRELGLLHATSVTVESIDDHILELAGLAGCKAVNPVFRARERVVADIIPRRPHAASVPVRLSRNEMHEEVRQELREDATRSASRFFEAWSRRFSRVSKPFRGSSRKERRRVPEARIRERYAIGRIAALSGITLLVLLLLGGVAFWFLPSAVVVLSVHRTENPFTITVEVSTSTVLAAWRDETLLVPGELFRVSRNTEQSFPATETRVVERAATGKLRVFNAFSSSEQALVVATRFQSPDGLVFRLNERVTVPGARIENGSIIPSSIVVAVSADKPGETYNIGPVEGWRIPGFQGTPKYDGFYAVSEGPMQGGIVGEEAVPTEAERENAQAVLRGILEKATTGELSFLPQDDLVVLDAAQAFSLKNISVSSDRNAPKQFRMFAEGERRQLVFRKSDAERLILEKMQAGMPIEVRAEAIAVSYESVEADLVSGRMRFRATGSVQFVPRIDMDGFREFISGKTKEDVQHVELNGVSKVSSVITPRLADMIGRFPQRTSRIDVRME